MNENTYIKHRLTFFGKDCICIKIENLIFISSSFNRIYIFKNKAMNQRSLKKTSMTKIYDNLTFTNFQSLKILWWISNMPEKAEYSSFDIFLNEQNHDFGCVVVEIGHTISVGIWNGPGIKKYVKFIEILIKKIFRSFHLFKIL